MRRTGKEISTLLATPPRWRHAVTRPMADGSLSGGRNGEVKIWDAVLGKRNTDPRPDTKRHCSGKFSPDGKRAITASLDGTLRIWNADTGDELLILRAPRASLNSCEFSPDGKSIVSGGADGRLTLWDSSLTGRSSAIRRPREAHHELRILAGRQVCLFRLRGRHAEALGCGHPRAEEHLSRARRGCLGVGRFRSTAADLRPWRRTARLIFWDVESGKALRASRNISATIHAIAFFGDGSRVISGSWDTDTEGVEPGSRGTERTAESAMPT